MKKSLLLAALLLPCAAQAEIFFCATSSTTLIFTKTGTGNIIAEEPNGSDRELNFVIDTENGVRPAAGEDPQYRGTCEKKSSINGPLLSCYYEDQFRIENLNIVESDLFQSKDVDFTHSSHILGLYIQSSAGKCTKA
ncbi:hypothetical protein N9D35_02185 [Gammaproteobacteria bacterium]|nr:hypothetical protein [Gammaproteobacteria bacterium]